MAVRNQFPAILAEARTSDQFNSRYLTLNIAVVKYFDEKNIRTVSKQQARDYLESCGLIWECSNYLCPAGKIDLIMCDPGVCADQETIVFVEVRYRKAWDYGESVETVVWHKQHRIIKAAWHYLIRKQRHR